MERYKVILAYDGTEFVGFQRQVCRSTQASGRTVQGVVETALRNLGWQEEVILAAGRTDSGVHAAGQVISFNLEWQHGLLDFQAALNANLPADVSAVSVQVVQPDFHPRYDAAGRHYRYRIYCRSLRDPLRDRYYWRVWPPVQLNDLQFLADQLLGTHDFAAFGIPPRSQGSTVRTVFRADWKLEGEELIFDIIANAFLYRMVRRLVYAQVRAVQGKLGFDLLEKLSGESPSMVQGLAPPQGLLLAEVIY